MSRYDRGMDPTEDLQVPVDPAQPSLSLERATRANFERLLQAITDYERATGRSLWEHVVEKAFTNLSILKLVVDKLLPRRHELQPVQAAGQLVEAELDRIREERRKLYLDLEAKGAQEQVPLVDAPAPPDDEVMGDLRDPSQGTVPPVTELEGEVLESLDKGPDDGPGDA